MRCELVSNTSAPSCAERASASARCTIFSAEPRQWTSFTPYFFSKAAASARPSCTVIVL